MTHNEYIDYMHARFWWALFYSCVSIGLTVADIAPEGVEEAYRQAILYVLVFPLALSVMTFLILLQQCGWFENMKHPEVIPVGAQCPFCKKRLETGDRVRASYRGDDPEEFFCHIDCDDPKGINIDWLRLNLFDNGNHA